MHILRGLQRLRRQRGIRKAEIWGGDMEEPEALKADRSGSEEYGAIVGGCVCVPALLRPNLCSIQKVVLGRYQSHCYELANVIRQSLHMLGSKNMWRDF